jgi:phage gpG-like protein
MIGVSLEGADALDQRLGGYADALANDLTAKASVLATALADKVKFEKLSGEVLNTRSGALKDSIAAEVSTDGDGILAVVGSQGDVKYAAIQEYGGRTAAHEILPDKASVLAFLVGGVARFARRVQHPGSNIPDRSYLRSSLDEMRDDIVAALTEAINQSWEAS